MDIKNNETTITSTITHNFQAENDSFDNLTTSTADKNDDLNITDNTNEMIVEVNMTKLDLLIQREKLSFQIKKKPIANKNYCDYKNDVTLIYHNLDNFIIFDNKYNTKKKKY